MRFCQKPPLINLSDLKYLIFGFVLTVSSICSAQKLTFDIYLFGNIIGQTVVERVIKNDSIAQYTLNSNSEAHVLLTTRITTLNYDITYKRGHLFTSYSKHTRNDELHITSVQWQGGKYVITSDKVVSNLAQIIDCSTVKLFFAEPCSPTSVFSERLGENRALKKTADGVYQADMKEGITYIYRYKNGKLVELEMKNGILGSSYIRPHQ